VEWLAGRADVVHGTNFVLPPLRRAAGVLTVHDLSYLRYPETVAAASLRYRTLVPRGLRRAAVVVTPSQAVAAEVRAEYGLGDRVLATPLGVDEGWFGATPMPAPSWPPAACPSATCCSSATSSRARACRRCCPRCGCCTTPTGWRRHPPLVLAGPPGWGPALETAALPPGAVVSAGYLDTADLRRLVAGAALLAYPSVYEGFGLPPLEAFAAGVPVVASDLPVVREVTGELAALAPVGDAAALAAAVRATLADPGDRPPAGTGRAGSPGPPARPARRGVPAGRGRVTAAADR
jgi:hypothetical protein